MRAQKETAAAAVKANDELGAALKQKDKELAMVKARADKADV